MAFCDCFFSLDSPLEKWFLFSRLSNFMLLLRVIILDPSTDGVLVCCTWGGISDESKVKTVDKFEEPDGIVLVGFSEVIGIFGSLVVSCIREFNLLGVMSVVFECRYFFEQV